jgi:NDP-sugar pyrophosphorylase family protein
VCLLLPLLLPRSCVLSGDTVSNMDLGPALAAHKERADRDKDAILTMVRTLCYHVFTCAIEKWSRLC